MSFSEEQIAALNAPLMRDAVKQRQQAGRNLSYIEAYHAENEANRIFGFDAWDRETELTLIGETVVGDKNRVYYRAKAKITVRTPTGGVVIREGCGYGSGIDKDLGQAHESALKEAESDAEKRALKTFGNPFGQALYDKSQANVVDAPPPEPVLETSMTAGKDWWKCNGAQGLSAHAAKQKGLDKDHDEFRQEILAATSSEEWKAICAKYADRIAVMPLSWRIEARADADFRAEELGIFNQAA